MMTKNMQVYVNAFLSQLLNVKCLNSFTDGQLHWIYGSCHGGIGGPIAFVK